MRRKSCHDANHKQVVHALERFGCRVVDLSRVGGGCADILVYRPSTGLLRLIEIKTAKGKLSEAQEAFRGRYPVWIARSELAALLAMGIEAGEVFS